MTIQAAVVAAYGEQEYDTIIFTGTLRKIDQLDRVFAYRVLKPGVKWPLECAPQALTGKLRKGGY